MFLPKWGHNSCLAAECVTILSLLQSIVENTREMNAGRIKTNIDSLTVHDNIACTKLKARTLAGDGGAIVSQV